MSLRSINEGDENIMNILTSKKHMPVLNMESPNWVTTSPLPRDQEQSHRLHEPDHQISTIDPITGRDIGDVSNHPFLVDGNLTIYFESEKTKARFEHTPLNHPYEHSLGKLPVDMDRGG
jgi:YHS domain-containing protein